MFKTQYEVLIVGIVITWDMSACKLLCQSDSQLIIDFVKRVSSKWHNLTQILPQIIWNVTGLRRKNSGIYLSIR